LPTENRDVGAVVPMPTLPLPRAVRAVVPPETSWTLPVVALPSWRVWLLVVPRIPVALSEVAPVVADNEAVGVPPATFTKANFALVVAVDPRSRSWVLILSVIAPFDCSNGEPPLPIGKMPVTSPDARLTALDERTPVDER